MTININSVFCKVMPDWLFPISQVLLQPRGREVLYILISLLISLQCDICICVILVCAMTETESLKQYHPCNAALHCMFVRRSRLFVWGECLCAFFVCDVIHSTSLFYLEVGVYCVTIEHHLDVGYWCCIVTTQTFHRQDVHYMQAKVSTSG